MTGEDAPFERAATHSIQDPDQTATKDDKSGSTDRVEPANATQTAEVDEWGLPLKKIAPVREVEKGKALDETAGNANQAPTEAAGKENIPEEAVEGEKSRDDAHIEKEKPLEPEQHVEFSNPTPRPRAESEVSKRTSTHSQPSAWSHQQLAPGAHVEEQIEEADEWQAMPAYAPFDMYNDDGKLVAKEMNEEEEEEAYTNLGGAAKGYTKVQMDEDAQSATSMDDNTAYLFKEPKSNALDEDEEGRDMLSQMQATKTLLTEGQKIAYVGIVRLAMIEMVKELSRWEKTKNTKKPLEFAVEQMTMWSQMIMLRLYGHMEIESAGRYLLMKIQCFN
jgi:hypothetical protein